MAAPGPAILGVDVGGTSVKARLVGGPGDSLLVDRRVPTPLPDPDGSRLAEAVVHLVRAASAAALDRGTTLGGVGLVVPGLVDESAGRVQFAANLGWRDLPVHDNVARALRSGGFELPLAFGHDVRAGALAEAESDTRSAGEVVAFVPVGTGLASAVVVDGQVLLASGAAGEIGQLRISSGPHAGRRVEDIASASGVARRCGAADASAAAELVRTGDAAARGAWNDCVTVLADALAWLTAVTGCSRVIIGGGLAGAGSLLLDPLRAELGLRLDRLPEPTIVSARHGDAAGAIGAVLLARRLIQTRRGAGE